MFQVPSDVYLMNQQNHAQLPVLSTGSRQSQAPLHRSPAVSASATQPARNYCVLCRTNGEPREIYESHVLKDSAGRVTCPILYGYHCPFCGATGPQVMPMLNMSDLSMNLFYFYLDLFYADH